MDPKEKDIHEAFSEYCKQISEEAKWDTKVNTIFGIAICGVVVACIIVCICIV